MNNQQIKDHIYSLGKSAVKLHDIELLLYKTSNANPKFDENLRVLVDFVNKHADAQDVIIQLSRDTRADIREIAASLINYLWKYWKYIPYDEVKRPEYENAMRNYAEKLSWTIPLIKDLIRDRAEQPVLISLYDVWEMDYVNPNELALLRDAALSVCGHKSVEVRKALVRTLTNFYPDNEEALHILDELALQFYINATYDSDDQIRDWALFELHISVENLNDKAAKAFLDAFDRESPKSDAYMEAAIGMARMGLEYDRLKTVVLEKLSRTDCGSGWFDIAEYMHSQEILKALKELYDEIDIDIHNDLDHRPALLKEVIDTWED